MANALRADKEAEFSVARGVFIRAEGDAKLASQLASKHYDVRITPKRIEALAERFDWFTLLDNVRQIVAENFATDAALRREKNQLFLSRAKLKLMHAILGEVETDTEGRVTKVVKRAVEARSLEGCIRALVDVFGEERHLFGEKEPSHSDARGAGVSFMEFIISEAQKAKEAEAEVLPRQTGNGNGTD